MKKLVALVMTLSLTLALFAGMPAKKSLAAGGDVTDGLVAHWTFDGNINESVQGMVTTEEEKPIKYVDGVFGKAASFNGKDMYLRVKNCEELELDTKTNGDVLVDCGQAITISFWINCPDLECKNMCIVDKGYWAGWNKEDDIYWADPYMVSVDDSNDISFEITSEYVNNNAGINLSESKRVSKGFQGNEWQLITVTYDGRTVKYYCDNELYAQANYTDGYVFNNDDLFIGARSRDNICDYLKGSLDDLRIYKRALSYNEVNTLYQNGVAANKEVVEPKEQLVAYYAFDGNTKDDSTFGNDAEIVEIGGTTKYVYGVNGKAITMKKGNYIRVPAAKQLDFEKDFSISLWYKSDLKEQSSPLLYRLDPARGGSNENDATYTVYMNCWGEGECTDSSFWMEGFNKDVWCATDGTSIGISRDKMKRGDEWNHVTYTYSYDKENEKAILKAYCNGKLVNKNDGINCFDISNAEGDLYIGFDNDTFFTGAIDELKIYNKCLSATEVAKEAKRVDTIKITNINKIGSGKTITVKKGNKVTVEGIEITDVDEGKKTTVKSSDSNVTFKSSNKKIFTVTNKGVIKGVKSGTAKLTVTIGGVSMIYTVKVTK